MSHGGNIKKLRELAGDIELIDFSASINPMGSPEWLRREIARNINETEHYPDIESQELIATTAKVFRVAEDQITPANGTTDIIFSLPKIFNQHKAVIAQPSYVDYSEACKKEGLKIDSIALPSSENFKLDFNVLEKKLTKQSLVFLAHPNNPTGTLLDKKALTDIISIHQESIFIIDEAYLPFAPAPYNNDSFIDLIDTNPNLIVLRSLTKVYAMAGLRLGLAFAAKELTAVLRDSQTPWSVNTLSQKVGVRALQDINYATKTRKNIDELRYELLRRLGNFSNLHIYPTRSNFILCRIKSGFTADELFSKLIQQGIAIRCYSDFENLDNTYFRVVVRNNTENTRLITALAAIFNNNRPH